MFMHPQRALTVLLALPLLGLAGCQLDTQVRTRVAADGSVHREIELSAKDVEAGKAREAVPPKELHLPQASVWKIREQSASHVLAEVDVPRGQPLPGGYDFELKATGAHAHNEAHVTVRDHFLATSYRYEERFCDTVKPEAGQTAMLAEFDRVSAAFLKRAQKDFPEYDFAAAERYVTKDLRKLVADTNNTIAKSGVMPALLRAFVSLSFGGFHMKLDDVFNADPRDALRSFLAFMLRRAQLRPDADLNAQDGVSDEAFAALVKTLGTGSPEEQVAAQKKLEAAGVKVVRRLEAEAKLAPRSESGVRFQALAKSIREADAARVDTLAAETTKELEAYYLHPPKEQAAERDKLLATILGAHIEGNFASIDYTYLLRVELPGELAAHDDDAQSVEGGARWNFGSLSFYMRDMVCWARSRVWKANAVAGLAVALAGNAEALGAAKRDGIEEALAELDDAPLEQTCAALKAAVTLKSRKPIEELEKTGGQSGAAAKKILELVPAK